jgi:hypothetical protein
MTPRRSFIYTATRSFLSRPCTPFEPVTRACTFLRVAKRCNGSKTPPRNLPVPSFLPDNHPDTKPTHETRPTFAAHPSQPGKIGNGRRPEQGCPCRPPQHVSFTPPIHAAKPTPRLFPRAKVRSLQPLLTSARRHDALANHALRYKRPGSRCRQPLYLTVTGLPSPQSPTAALDVVVVR